MKVKTDIDASQKSSTLNIILKQSFLRALGAKTIYIFLLVHTWGSEQEWCNLVLMLYQLNLYDRYRLITNTMNHFKIWPRLGLSYRSAFFLNKVRYKDVRTNEQVPCHMCCRWRLCYLSGLSCWFVCCPLMFSSNHGTFVQTKFKSSSSLNTLTQ